MWAPYVRYAFDSYNRDITHHSLEFFERRIGPVLPTPAEMGVPPNTGRLCASCSGDGKRRLFAVGNYINQRLLYPIHQWLAKILSMIPMDGTFDQRRKHSSVSLRVLAQGVTIYREIRGKDHRLKTSFLRGLNRLNEDQANLSRLLPRPFPDLVLFIKKWLEISKKKRSTFEKRSPKLVIGKCL